MKRDNFKVRSYDHCFCRIAFTIQYLCLLGPYRLYVQGSSIPRPSTRIIFGAAFSNAKSFHSFQTQNPFKISAVLFDAQKSIPSIICPPPPNRSTKIAFWTNIIPGLVIGILRYFATCLRVTFCFSSSHSLFFDFLKGCQLRSSQYKNRIIVNRIKDKQR